MGIMARVTVDEIVTEYEMDDSKFQAGTNRVLSGTMKLHGSIGSLMSKMASFAGSALPGVGLALGGLGASIFAGGIFAAKASIEFDTLTRKLEAVTGSAQRAKAVMAFVDQLAIPSVFESQPLAEAATLLEAFGLQTEKYLPIAEKLATVFGSGASGLGEYVSALGRLKAGQFGEAFESLRRAGISTDILKSKGLQFDKGGQFLGSAEQALNAVEQLVNEKFGKMAGIMQNGPGAKIASLMDQLSRVFRQVGDVVVTSFLPVIDKVSAALGNLVQNGSITKISESIAKMFDPGKFADTLLQTVAFVIAGFKTLPTILQGLHAAFDKIKTQAIMFVSIIAGVFLAGPILTGIEKMIVMFKSLRATIQATGLAAMIMEAIATGGASLGPALAAAAVAAAAALGLNYILNKALDSAGGAVGKIPGMSDLVAEQQSIYKQLTALAAGGPTLKNSDSKGGPGGGPAGASSTLGRIATATEKTAKNTDLNNQVLGGGTLAKQGINRQELHDLAAASGRGGGKTARELVQAIENHFFQLGQVTKMSRREV